MDVEEKQKEQIKQKIKQTFQESFEKEGEVAYITANLTETREKTIKNVAKSEQEKEYGKQQYENLLQEVKEEMKKEKNFFQNVDAEIREKANILNQIHQEYWEFEKQFGKMYYKPNHEKKLREWEQDLEKIESVISTEFSIPSLEKIDGFMKEKNQTAFSLLVEKEPNKEKTTTQKHEVFPFWRNLFHHKKVVG